MFNIRNWFFSHAVFQNTLIWNANHRGNKMWPKLPERERMRQGCSWAWMPSPLLSQLRTLYTHGKVLWATSAEPLASRPKPISEAVNGHPRVAARSSHSHLQKPGMIFFIFQELASHYSYYLLWNVKGTLMDTTTSWNYHPGPIWNFFWIAPGSYFTPGRVQFLVLGLCL